MHFFRSGEPTHSPVNEKRKQLICQTIIVRIFPEVAASVEVDERKDRTLGAAFFEEKAKLHGSQGGPGLGEMRGAYLR
jgi:hypothetical protein